MTVLTPELETDSLLPPASTSGGQSCYGNAYTMSHVKSTKPDPNELAYSCGIIYWLTVIVAQTLEVMQLSVPAAVSKIR